MGCDKNQLSSPHKYGPLAAIGLFVVLVLNQNEKDELMCVKSQLGSIQQDVSENGS